MSASAALNMRLPGERRSSADTTAAATSAMATNNGVCQPGAPARKLNAAPLLKASTRLKKPVMRRRSPGAKLASTAHLLAWSASPNQPAPLGIRARLPGAEQVRHAAPAELRMRRFGADVSPVVPAALALGVRARRHVDAFGFSARSARHACRRGEQHEPEIVA